MMRRAGLSLALVSGLASGCLENLNQQKYFDVLEASDPALASRVDRHREAIEQHLRRELESRAPAPATHIGLWGESWDVVRRVTDGEQLFMRGRIFHADEPASTYYLAFTVDEQGTVGLNEARVYAVQRGPG